MAATGDEKNPPHSGSRGMSLRQGHQAQFTNEWCYVSAGSGCVTEEELIESSQQGKLREAVELDCSQRVTVHLDRLKT